MQSFIESFIFLNFKTTCVLGEVTEACVVINHVLKIQLFLFSLFGVINEGF